MLANTVFIPCNNSLLNLAGIHVSALNPNAVTFFGTTERIFIHFSSSTHHWEVLTKHSKIIVKRVCNTQWSATYDAVSSLVINLVQVISASKELSEGVYENLDTQSGAEAFLIFMMPFTFTVYLFFWNLVLK